MLAPGTRLAGRYEIVRPLGRGGFAHTFGSDTVLPYVAARWRAGDTIEVLYLPERNYDSVIISAG